VLQLDSKVMGINVRAQLDFFDLVGVLMLLRFLLHLGLLVAILAEIDYATDGGVAFGAISTKSTALARARLSASPSDMMPSCFLSAPMTRTSRARIFPLIRTKDAGEPEERGKKGGSRRPHRLKLIHAVFKTKQGIIPSNIKRYKPVCVASAS